MIWKQRKTGKDIYVPNCWYGDFSTIFLISSSFSAKAKTIFEDVKKIIYQIERAIRHKKIFCLGGCFPSARKALIKRGWVEVASRSRSAMGRPQNGTYQREGHAEDAG